MPQSKEGEPKRLSVVIQDFDNREILTSVSARLDMCKVLAENIDNAYDKRISGRTLHFLAQFYPNDKRIIFCDKNTRGMTEEDIQTYVRFGQFGRERDENERGIHGFGGKVTHLWMLGDTGSLKLISSPRDSNDVYSVYFESWKQNLIAGKDWSINRRPKDESDADMTRFIFEGVEKSVYSKGELVSIARKLGVIYGNDIKNNDIAIILELIKGKKVCRCEVKPETISFLEDGKNQIEKVSGKKGDGPVVNVTWGQIDVPQRDNNLKVFSQTYEIDRSRPILTGNSIHVYNRGKYVQGLKLEEVGYPYYLPRLGFSNWAVVVNIKSGKVGLDLFKEKLVSGDPATVDVLHTVKSLTSEDVKNISQESERRRVVTLVQKEKTKLANEVFDKTMTSLWSTKEAFAREYNLMSTRFVRGASKLPDEVEEEIKRKGGYVPGSRSTYTHKGYRNRGEGETIVPSYAGITAGYFGDSELETKFIDAKGKVYIMVNLQNVAVITATKGNKKDASLALLRFAVEALVQRKYYGQAPYDTLQREVSSVLEEARFILGEK